MKKILSICLTLCLILSLAACSKTPDTPPTEVDDGIYYKNEYIAINDYSDIIFDFYQFDVTDEDLQLYINYHILLPNAIQTEVREGIVQKEDYVNISVTTKDENGKLIEKYCTGDDGYFLYIGLGDFMPDLDSEIVGMNVGETKNFNTVLTIEAATVQATVEVTVNYIQVTELPEASDELAVKEGYASLEAFKNEFREQLLEEYSADAYKVFMDSVKKLVIKEVYIYPQDMLNSYIEKYHESLDYFAAKYKMSRDDYLEKFSRMTYDEWLNQVTEQAKKDVETELMLNAILEAHDLTLDERAYAHYLEIMAQSAGYSSGAALESEMENQGVSSDLTRELTMNYAYDIFLLTAKMRLINWGTGEIIVDYVEQTNTTN